MIQYLLNEQYQSDVEFLEYLQERMEIESDMILSCMENNIILEAEGEQKTNKTSWLDKAKELIHKVFGKFIEKFTDNSTEKKLEWFEKNKDKFANLDYSGLSTKLSPRWKYSTQTMTATTSKIIGMLETNNFPKPNELENLKSREEVEKYKEFGKITINGKTFGESVKIKFSGGTDGEPELITINENSSPSFSDVCLKYAIPYITNYKKTIASFRQLLQSYDRVLDASKTEIERLEKSQLKESYVLIEDCPLSESSIFYLLEADNEETKTEGARINDNKNDEKPKEGKIVDNNKENANNKETTALSAQLQYSKHCINLVQLTMATYLTETEKRFNIYMTLLQDTLKSRGKDIETKVDDNKNKEEKKKK